MDKKNTCLTCKHKEKEYWELPCRKCAGFRFWEPEKEESKPGEKSESIENRVKKQIAENLRWAQEDRKEKKSSYRPKALPQPVYNYERELSIYPDSIRVSFEDGTTAIYTMQPEQPKPQVIETIRIIRKWNSEGYQCKVQKRRRRCEK